MKIIAIIAAVALCVTVGLTVYARSTKDKKAKKRITNAIYGSYIAVWVLFLLAYFFHNENVLARYAAFDFGGIVLFWDIIFVIALLRSIYDKKKYLALRILGVLLLALVGCAFIWLAPLNAEIEGTVSTFYPVVWYVYYLVGAPVVALSYGDDILRS